MSRTPTCATLAHCGVLVSYEMRCDVVDNAIREHLSMLRFVCHGCFTPSSDISPLIASRPPAILALWLPHALRRYQLIVCLTPSGDISLVVCLTPSGDISSVIQRYQLIVCLTPSGDISSLVAARSLAKSAHWLPHAL